jgi:hypothetical protein
MIKPGGRCVRRHERTEVHGSDVMFNIYRDGGNGAGGMTLVPAAVNPANPLSPANTGQPGRALGSRPPGRARAAGPMPIRGIGPAVALPFSCCSDIFSARLMPGLLFQVRI